MDSKALGVKVNQDELLQLLAGSGVDVDPERLQRIREQAAMLLRALQAKERLGSMPEVSGREFGAMTERYGATPVGGINETAAPFSPEEKARRAMLDWMTDAFYKAEGSGGPPLLSRPFSGQPVDKGGVYALSQIAALLKGLLEGQRRLDIQERALEMQPELEALKRPQGGATPGGVDVAGIIARAKQRGDLSPEDVIALMNSGYSSEAITQIRKSLGKKVPPIVEQAQKQLAAITKLRDITGNEVPEAAVARRALALLTLGDYRGAVEEIRKIDPQYADMIARAIQGGAAGTGGGGTPPGVVD